MVKPSSRDQTIIDMWNEGRDIDAIARAAHCTTHAAYEVVRRWRVKEPDGVCRRPSGFEIKARRYKKRLNYIGLRLMDLFVSGDVDPCQNLTTEKVAAVLDISVITVRKIAKRGDLRSHRRGRRYVFELGDVAEWAASL